MNNKMPAITPGSSHGFPDFKFRIVILVLVLAAVGAYLPVFFGYVPFPAMAVVQFPPWTGYGSDCCLGIRQAELGDIATQAYPWHVALRTALRLGHVPLWNSQVYLGTPFETEPQTGVLNPMNWLFVLGSAPTVWAFLFVVRTILIGLTTAWFVRRLGSTAAGALISGLCFAFSGWITAFQGRAPLDTAMWLPAMFLSIDLLREKPSGRTIAFAAAMFSLLVLGGHPEIAAQLILLGVFYAIYRLFPLIPASSRYAGAFSLAGILAVLIASGQILPTFEWLYYIPRSLNRHWDFLPLREVVTFLSRDYFRNRNIDGIFVPEGAAYAGAFALAAFPFTLLWRKRRDVVFFLVLAFVCLEFTFGWFPFGWIESHVPVFSGLPPWRFLVGVNFALAVLAGLAVSAIQVRCRENRFQIGRPGSLLVALSVALTVSAAICLVVLRIGNHTSAPYQYTLLIVLAALANLVLAATGRMSARLFVSCALLLVTSDLLSYSFGYVGFVRSRDVFPQNAAFDFLKEHAGTDWRVASIDSTYGTNFEIVYGLATASGYDFPLTRSVRFLSTFSLNRFISFNSTRVLAAANGALDLTGTRYLVATDWNNGAAALAAHPDRFKLVFNSRKVMIFENASAVPRAFVVPGSAVKVVTDEEAQLAHVLDAGFNPRQTAILPKAIEGFAGLKGTSKLQEAVKFTQGWNEMRASVQTNGDGLLIFDEAFYPGWFAEVDGKAAQIERADYTLMGVPVSRGQHTVVLTFRPTSFRIGAWLSCVGLLLSGCLVVWDFRYSRREAYQFSSAGKNSAISSS